MIDLTGRAALVTGASRGIGAATARILARAGADVAIHYRKSRSQAEEVAAHVERHGRRAVLLQADLRDLKAAEVLPRDACAALGKLDILVNNAGIWTQGSIEDLSLETWQETMRLNLDAVFVVTQAAVPLLQRSGRGVIVNVASTAALRGEPEHAAYAASKGAVVSFTKTLAVELAPRLRVNAVAPGWVETDMVLPDLGRVDRRAAIEHAIPRGRVASPEEVAGPILFLVSDLARHITGEILDVNGGALLCG